MTKSTSAGLSASIYIPEMARVIDTEQMAESEKLLTIESPNGGLGHTPGQFVMVSALGVGEAPISITSSPSRSNGRFEICVRNVGDVTNALHALQQGDVADEEQRHEQDPHVEEERRGAVQRPGSQQPPGKQPAHGRRRDRLGGYSAVACAPPCLRDLGNGHAEAVAQPQNENRQGDPEQRSAREIDPVVDHSGLSSFSSRPVRPAVPFPTSLWTAI